MGCWLIASIHENSERSIVSCATPLDVKSARSPAGDPLQATGQGRRSAITSSSQFFRLESDMFEPILAAIPDVFPTRGLRTRVLREPSIGNVVPDLLIGQWDSTEDCRFPSLTNVARHVLTFIEKNGPSVSAQSLEEQLFLSTSGLSRAVDQLCRAGLVAVHDSGRTLGLSSDLERFTGFKLIAVELKMRRWKEALHQAIRYLEFADESYVFLDGSQVDVTPEMRRTFELSAPGLYMHRGANFERLFEACSTPAVGSADRWQALHKLLASTPYCEA